MPMKTDKAGSYLITLRAAQKFIMGANRLTKQTKLKISIGETIPLDKTTIRLKN